MMKRTIFLALALLSAACERGADTSGTTTTTAPLQAEREGSRPGENRAADNRAADNRAADNTGKNERDTSATALTSGDQGGNEADRAVTQRVRQGVTSKEGLSINAQNVKIITQDGVVTLRGPVKTAQEKTDIGAIAQGVSGVKRVDNQLEVATN